MLALSFAAMYTLMYAMVDRFANVFMNFNQVYMAALMTAPMAAIELLVMRSMYRNQRLNIFFLAGSVIVFAVAWFGIRQQLAVSDRQFLRSMIPHHASAILMCRQAAITDPEIHRLCAGIVESQQSEIDLMKRMLDPRQ